uniref:Pre-mRNA-splicing regulator female-lethal(2)D n=1 Tax=Glossina brevipalpis TaxID=37001 RepID=A0A1A9WIU9_9MUSC
MSVAAMTLDDHQRPLMNSYEKMSKQYEQNLQNSSSSMAMGGSSSASNNAGLLSGPASPTPSGSEELNTAPTTNSTHHSAYHHSHHHHHHHHHAHHTHHAQQQQQQQHCSPPPPLSSSLISTTTSTTVAANTTAQHQQSSPNTIAAAVVIAAAEQRQRQLEEEVDSLKLEQSRLTQQFNDAQRREKILMRRLANKELEFQDYVVSFVAGEKYPLYFSYPVCLICLQSQIAEYKAAQAPSAVALRTALLDPAVNLLFEKLKKELKATKAKLEETQNELSAWKFTPDSNTGKRLMAKCRLLYQENEELGKMTSNGRLAKLETELAMQKSFSEEVKKSQSELDDFLQELDEDVEGMQSTILFLQQELKTTRERIQVLEKENYQLKNGVALTDENKMDVDVDNSHTKVEEAQSPVSAPVQVDDNSNVNGNNETEIIDTYKADANLETTIDENAALNIQEIQSNTSVYYNGTEDTPVATDVVPVVVPVLATDSLTLTSLVDSSNEGVVLGTKLRTMASRKRTYDCEPILDTNIITQPPIPIPIPIPVPVAPPAPVVVVASPRTLPPKKSKLRVTPARRTSVQSIGEHEVLTITPVDILNVRSDDALTQLPTIENANNETETPITGGIVGQRIVARRRSVRLNGGAGTSGGESNH